MNLKDIQNVLVDEELDGWLLYDFRRSNSLACKFLEISTETLLTRRFFYWIPQKGNPVKIVHIIESGVLDHLPGQVMRYRTWQEMEEFLASSLSQKGRVAMEYSPRNAIPTISKVDAGTVEMVRGLGVEVVSSAALLQKYTSVLTEEQLKTHLYAAELLDQIAENTWQMIGHAIQSGHTINEYDVQQYMLKLFAANNCITEDPPICAVNANSANPHYSPQKNGSKTICKGDFILIDLWCKQDISHAIYGDITRVGVAAAQPTARQLEIFSIVKEARDAATQLVKDRFAKNTPIMGCEADQCCRDIIEKAGYGERFIHRTGHNIGEQDHGSGANLDNLETRDTRFLLAGTCFSIEPGIYLPGEFGVRLEYDLYVHANGNVQITGGVQDEIRCLL